ncbi:hypothetical protein KBY30_20875 [Ruegeria pomeroyi]|nr:hypothetical protein [Ruegeria pomeroyi]
MHRFTPILVLLTACTGPIEEVPVSDPAPVDLSFCKGDDLGEIVGQPVADVA